jgi:RimJ/RimL family protein N-acetyltransferase
MRVIATPSCTLEPQVAAHADAMFAVLSDPAIYEHENAPPASVGALRERYRKLESRRSGDGREQWLNWVVRVPDGELAGYVQATVYPDSHAAVAYEFASRYWGRGLARAAVEAMIDELAASYGVRMLSAVLKRGNERSRRFLERLDFARASPERHHESQVETDEMLMERDAPAPRQFDGRATPSS